MEKKNNADMFEIDGPLLIEKEYGPELSLRKIVKFFYSAHFPEEKAGKLTQKYIENWNK